MTTLDLPRCDSFFFIGTIAHTSGNFGEGPGCARRNRIIQYAMERIGVNASRDQAELVHKSYVKRLGQEKMHGIARALHTAQPEATSNGPCLRNSN